MKTNFPVTGMSCAACAVSVESMLRSQPGIQDVTVNYAGQEVWIEYNPDEISPGEFQKSLRSIGYDLIIVPGRERELQEEYQRNHYRRLKKHTLGAALFSLPVFILAMAMDIHFPGKEALKALLAAPVVMFFGRDFFINAYRQTRHGLANMDTLVAISTGIAFLFSLFNVIFPQLMASRGMTAQVYFESAAVIITFVLLGRTLEERAKNKTSGALKKLIGLQPKTVIRFTEGKEESCGIEQLIPGDILVIKPGEKIPVDGIIAEGFSTVDESSVTGEAIPVEKVTGERVFAGTINQQGLLKIEAQKIGSESLLGQIIRMVEEAQASKAPIQKVADRIAGIFVPVVLALSLITFAAWFITGGFNELPRALLAMVSVLIIACPCALGLATPTAIITGMGKGAENGILFRDAANLEVLNKVDVIVFDKTGTLTHGHPEVTAYKGDPSEEALAVLKEIESRSDHPLAKAVVRYLDKVDPLSSGFTKYENIPGKGIIAEKKDATYKVGNATLMEDTGCPVKEFHEECSQWEQEGMTTVFFCKDNKLLSVLALADPVREEAAGTIEKLAKAGLKVWMVTGDRRATAEHIARKLGIQQLKAGVLPLEKSNFIQDLHNRGKIVAMVGDGINDSAALAVADTGIAMNNGSDIALESAGITLVHNDLGQILHAIRLSAKTVKTIRQNLFWAFIYNIIAIPLAAGVSYPFTGFLLSPMVAAAAMAMSSVSVVTNSLRLRYTNL